MLRRPEVVVVGGGLIGTAVARQLARRGARVRLVTDDRPGTASGVAAGVLSPTHDADEPTRVLETRALDRWPEFAAELERAVDRTVSFDSGPTVAVAVDDHGRSRLAEAAAQRTALDRDPIPCSAACLDRLLPGRASQIHTGWLLPGEGAVDPRGLWAALRTDLARLGGEPTAGTVARLDLARDGRCRGVHLTDGTRWRADTVVWASGAWAGDDQLPFELPVRPIAGDVLRLDTGGWPRPAAPVAVYDASTTTFLVPYGSSGLAVGATARDCGLDATPGPHAVTVLRERAAAALPHAMTYPMVDLTTGFRPMTVTGRPLLGVSPVPGLVLAVGHGRNGILLAPITAELITDLVLWDDWPAWADDPAVPGPHPYRHEASRTNDT